MGNIYFLRHADRHQYWNYAFLIFLLSYFVPAGSAAPKFVFLLLIAVPAALFFSFKSYRQIHTPSLVFILLVFCYAMIRSIDSETLASVAKASLAILFLLLAALRLPLLSINDVQRLSVRLILALIFYIILNAIHQHYTIGWVLGQRLSLLFGQSKSVIFTADLLVCTLAAYSWSCIKTSSPVRLVATNILVMYVALVFLQSRSIVPAWFACAAVMVFTELKSIRSRAIAVVTLAIAIGVIWLALFSSGLLQMVTARGDSYRLEIWSAYFSSARECGIITGCGWGRDLGFTANDGSAIAHPHSMYMQHLYWGGIIGLLLLIGTIAIPLVKGIKASTYATWPLLVGCVALAFDGKSLVSMPSERWLLVLLPLAVSIGEFSRNSRILPNSDSNISSAEE